MTNCNHNCSTCGSSTCNERKEPVKNNIKKIYAIHSGKGGVGKSFVTSMLAMTMAKEGYKVGILDADITGPSIPIAFGLKDTLSGTKEYMNPAITKSNIKVVSVNLLLEDVTQPVAWRGPILANAVKQFYEDVNWGDLDYLFIDMPPGTGDVVLTVFQQVKIDSVIIVTTPQDLVQIVVEKSINLAKKMDINILGVIENMAYIKCDSCDKLIYPFGQTQNYSINKLATLPIIPEINKTIDMGNIEDIDYPYLDEVVSLLVRAYDE